jgi:hypothetical protein
MTAVLDTVSDVQERVINAIGSTKAPVTKAVSTVVDYVIAYVPQVPAVPFAEQLPTPKDIIDNQAKFATKLVSTNKSVALAVAKAAQPLTDQLLDRTSGPARATKSAA